VLAALLAWRCGRPVQAMLDREAENLAAGNRGATRQHVRLGATDRGELVAISVDVLVNAGAYSTGGEGSDVAGAVRVRRPKARRGRLAYDGRSRTAYCGG
jgi:CO/xanthine dehydrogenase Mo-binding subunit